MIKMYEFKGETLLITGGTGSFGNAVLNRFLKTDIKEIRVFSRDEKKQDDMRHEFQAKMPEVADKIKFYIGDVRNLDSIRDAMHGVDYVFHALANPITWAANVPWGYTRFEDGSKWTPSIPVSFMYPLISAATAGSILVPTCR